MKAVILFLLLGQASPPRAGESFYEAYQREQGRPVRHLESTTIEVEKFGRDSIIVTERPQIWKKPSDSYGNRQRCERDKRNPNLVTCYDWNVR